MSRVKNVRVGSYLWKSNTSDYIFIMSPRFTSQTQTFAKLWVYFEDTSPTPGPSSYQEVEILLVWWYHMLGGLALNGSSMAVNI